MSCKHGNSDFSFDPCNECAAENAEWNTAHSLGKKDGWEACETCHGIVDGIHPSEAKIQSLTARLEAAEKENASFKVMDKFFCADCQDTGWLQNREEGVYPCTCMTEAEPYQQLQTTITEQAAQMEALKKDAERWRYALKRGFWCADNPNVEAYSKGGLMLTLHIHPINREGFISAIDAAREVKS